MTWSARLAAPMRLSELQGDPPGESRGLPRARHRSLSAADAPRAVPFAQAKERFARIEPSLPESGEDDAETTVVGRLVSRRHQGKTVFAHVRDGSGELQLYLRRDDVGRGSLRGLPQALRSGRFRAGERAALPHPGRRGFAARQRLRDLEQGAQRPAGEMARLAGRGNALPAALRGPDCQRRGARRLRDPVEDRLLDQALPRCTRFHRGGDADAATALRRRRGSAVHDHASRARPDVLSAHRRRALSEAADRRWVRARLRDRQGFPQRGDGPQSPARVHDAGVVRGVRGLRAGHGHGRGADPAGGDRRLRRTAIHQQRHRDRPERPVRADHPARCDPGGHRHRLHGVPRPGRICWPRRAPPGPTWRATRSGRASSTSC